MKFLKKITVLLFTGVASFHSFAQLPEQAEDISPLLYGETIPESTLTGQDGSTQTLSAIIGEKQTVLLFYRGGWCPYCNTQLAEVQKIENEISGLGYQIVAISPDEPGVLRKSLEKQALNYALYSDADGSLSKAIGIAFKAPERYSNKLFDNSGGKNDGFLPVPSVFVVDQNRTILFEYINPDYKTRISSALLLAALTALQQ